MGKPGPNQPYPRSVQSMRPPIFLFRTQAAQTFEETVSVFLFSILKFINLTHHDSSSTPVDSVRLHSLLVTKSSIPHSIATENLSDSESTIKLPLTSIYRPCMVTCYPRSAIATWVVRFYIQIAFRTLV